MKQTLSQTLLLLTLVLATVAVTAISLTIGSAHIPFFRTVAAAFGKSDPISNAIIDQIRLPRTLLALIVGGILGMSGAALQGYLRNPLAEPSTLGLSSCAALGGVIALYFGFAATSEWALPLFAIAAAVLGLIVLMALARLSEDAVTLILGGIAVGTLAGAAISLALNMSSDPFAANEIAFWLLGSVEDRSMQHVLLVLPFAIAGVILFLWDGKALDALSLGEETAKSLGFDLRWIEFRLMAAVALAVGAAVAVAGSIAFVGLVVPHILRPMVGSRASRLLIPSALLGAILLTASDILVRLVPTTNELKLGVVTAFLGTPFFLHLLFRMRRFGQTS